MKLGRQEGKISLKALVRKEQNLKLDPKKTESQLRKSSTGAIMTSTARTVQANAAAVCALCCQIPAQDKDPAAANHTKAWKKCSHTTPFSKERRFHQGNRIQLSWNRLHTLQIKEDFFLDSSKF